MFRFILSLFGYVSKHKVFDDGCGNLKVYCPRTKETLKIHSNSASFESIPCSGCGMKICPTSRKNHWEFQ